MEPIPETAEALRQVAEQGDSRLAATLATMTERIHRIAPDCVAVSVGLLSHQITFTLISDAAVASTLDAIQYLDGGPCVQAAHESAPQSWQLGNPLDEEAWSMFAQASAAAGIASTLSFPIVDSQGGQPVTLGTVNMYGTTVDTFKDRHRELAEVCNAPWWAAVADADLSFSTRLEAIRAPRLISDQYDIDRALRLLASTSAIVGSEASERLRDAAARADIDEATVARAILGFYSELSE